MATKREILTTKSKAAPRLIILGRGHLNGRRPTLIRLSPELDARMKRLTDGPNYLVIQVALERLLDDLEKRSGEAELIHADSLG